MSPGDSCFDWRNSTPRRPSSSSHFTSSYLPLFCSIFALSCMALILTSVRFCIDCIVEMLTLRKAPPPPELNISLRTVSVFQFAGSVQVTPCWSHFTLLPLAMAAVCAAVGLGFSTGSFPIFEGLLDEDDEFEELAFLNFSLRLQAATTNTNATIRETFFIPSPE